MIHRIFIWIKKEIIIINSLTIICVYCNTRNIMLLLVFVCACMYECINAMRICDKPASSVTTGVYDLHSLVFNSSIIWILSHLVRVQKRYLNCCNFRPSRWPYNFFVLLRNKSRSFYNPLSSVNMRWTSCTNYAQRDWSRRYIINWALGW